MTLEKCCIKSLASTQLLLIVLLLNCVFRAIASNNELDFVSSNMASSWAIRIPHKNEVSDKGLREIAVKIAKETGLSFHGQIGGLRGHFLLVHEAFYRENGLNDAGDLTDVLHKITEQLQRHPEIDWSMREKVRPRFKRSLRFKDQYFPSQWHLVSYSRSCSGIGLTNGFCPHMLDWIV